MKLKLGRKLSVGIFNKDRVKNTGKKPYGPEEKEKAVKKAADGLSEEDEATMSFISRKLKDSCSD